MNTLSVLPPIDTPQISESQIRTHLESVNRKLDAQKLQGIPINTADWGINNETAYMYADSIGSYIAELSDVIEAENDHREETRKKIEAELAKATALLRELKGKYEEEGYKENHRQTNALIKRLRENELDASVEVELGKMLSLRTKTDKEGEKLLVLIQNCDAQISEIRIRIGKVLKKIPDTFVDEVERNLKEIRIKQMSVIHILEPENQREVKKKPRNMRIIGIAVAVAAIVAGSLIKTEDKGTPGNNRGERSPLPEGVLRKSLILTKFADQICGAFENFIKNPKNLDATICTQYLGEMIAARGGKIQGEGLILKDAKFIRTLLETNGDRLEFSINCSYIIEDEYGNRFPEDAKIKIHLYGRLPWPERIETNLMQDSKLKNAFERAFLYQCQERFPPNNIYGLNIGSVKLLDQISHPENHISRLKVQFETNRGAIVLEKDSKIKE